MDAPTMHGYEITPGDEVDLNTSPHCCGGEMSTTSERLYRCDACSTVVEISPNGLVFDIR